MALKTSLVSRKNSDYKKVCDTMVEAFPENELVPIWLLLLLAKRKFTEFTSVYDGEQFCGLLYYVENKNYIFILYFAVDKNVRSKGYGRQILEFIKEKAQGRNIVLHAEYPDPKAINSEQRSKRMSFYSKNGIIDTGYFFGKGDNKYAVLSSDGPNVDIEAYRSLLKYLTFGFYSPKIHKKK